MFKKCIQEIQEGQTVDDDEDPLADLLVGVVLFSVPRQEHQDDVGNVGHEDG